MILLPYRLDQDLQRLHLPLWQQTKFGTKEHEVFKTRIQMGCHLQCLQGPEETTVDDSIDSE